MSRNRQSASPESHIRSHRGHISGRLHFRSSCVAPCGPGGCRGVNGGCGNCGDCGYNNGNATYNSCGPINIPYCAPLNYINPNGLVMGWMTPWGPRQPRLFQAAFNGCRFGSY